MPDRSYKAIYKSGNLTSFMTKILLFPVLIPANTSFPTRVYRKGCAALHHTQICPLTRYYQKNRTLLDSGPIKWLVYQK